MLGFLTSMISRKRLKQVRTAAYAAAEIGEMFEIEESARVVNESGDKSKLTIGSHVLLAGRVHSSPHASIEIGDYCYIASGVRIAAATSVKIGDYVGIASHTFVIDNNNHPIEPAARKAHRIRVAPGGEGYPSDGAAWEMSERAPIVIEDNVWIGMYCYIAKGITIGEGSIVARQSVVTKDVEPYVIVAGNPARVVKRLERPESTK